MIKKYENNPIITASDVVPSLEGYVVLGAFNPGATIFDDEILLLLRVAEGCQPKEGFIRVPVYTNQNGKIEPGVVEFNASDPDLDLSDPRGVGYNNKTYLSTVSHIRLARSTDGLFFTVEEIPFLFPSEVYEEYGVEDARVTCIDEKYYINYTAVSSDSYATALAVTKDFKTVEKQGIIFHPENKDVVIFPEKVNGKYIALHRPNISGFGKASIWYSESPDLLHWGNHQCIIRPRDGNQWESHKIGGGAPPIKTSDGWLVIYHGSGENNIYSLFCLLLDLEEPNKVIKRALTPFLVPTEPFEVNGFFRNVVFSNGLIEKDNKIYIYYGAADESVGVAITDREDLLSTLLES